ncbi:O-acetyl-ADP-ribose deacetylase [Halobacillus sp. B29]|uniref:O-acetyl-ADP-ribose deacetylase n=1 Tax=Halobacillus sp. B29 TaxID=3457432 RepID=UPI003FCE7547
MNHKIEVIQGDITKMEVDAVVNAANKKLAGGGGVDGAIHRAGGPSIMEESKQFDGCETGEAVVTTAGNMPSEKVIHTVGPVWNGGHKNEADRLADCYRNSLKRASEQGLRTVAFPNISTGIYGFPKEEAADIAIRTVQDYLEEHEEIEYVYFVCFDEENKQIYENRLSK